MATQANIRSRQPSQMAIQVQQWLSRYPDLSERELSSLIAAFPHLPWLDVGLLTADDRLSPKLEAFHRDHGAKLKAPVGALVAFLAVPLLLAAGALWWVLGA